MVEVIVVIAIICVLLAGIMPLFLNVVSTNKNNEYYAKAYKYADSRIEEYRNAPFSELTSGSFDINDLPQGKGTLVVGPVDGNQTDIKKVDLTVEWNFKRLKKVRLVTYIAKSGIRK